MALLQYILHNDDSGVCVQVDVETSVNANGVTIEVWGPNSATKLSLFDIEPEDLERLGKALIEAAEKLRVEQNKPHE